MKIAEFVTPEYPYPVPPGVVYAPLDVVAPLVEGLVGLGHEVTWYAPKDTQTSAELKTFGFSSLYASERWNKQPPDLRPGLVNFQYVVFLSHLVKEAANYDVIHLHSTRLALPFARLINKPIVMTLHNPMGTGNAHLYVDAHRDLKNVYYVSISDNQRLPEPDLQYISTIYHGLDLKHHPWSVNVGERWLWAGRIIPEKGADVAIRLAKQLNVPLDIAGPYYPDNEVNNSYFKNKIEPLFDGDQVRYLGALPRPKLLEAYAQSKGFIFPLQWDEPFGLTAIEALAAGTPVFTLNRGSMPEIIENGKTGFVANNEAKLLEAMKSVSSIDRRACRASAEERFSAGRMVNDYVNTFEQAIKLFNQLAE